jgi:hypothetical protein
LHDGLFLLGNAFDFFACFLQVLTHAFDRVAAGQAQRDRNRALQVRNAFMAR